MRRNSFGSGLTESGPALGALELPGCEAANVDVELVHPRIVAITCELNLKLKLILRALHSPPPVILVSGSLLAEAKEEALANGAFAFIPKPVDLAEFDRFVLLAIESRKGNR